MDTIVTPVTVITLDSTRIVHNIKADLVARYFPPVVRLVQYDQSLPVIAVSLMQNGQTYTLPSGAAANIRVHKPDATYVYNPALGCDSTRNIVYFEVTQAMAAASGDGLAIVEIVVDGDIAGTSLITLHFEENPVPEDAIESSDEWETIYELGERIIASTVTPVSTAAGMTDHNVVYLYTGTESGWNQGHMYYYNGTTWVDAGIAVTDTTLSVAGLAADAKKTGDEIADLKDGLTAIESDVTDLKEDLSFLTDWYAEQPEHTDGYLITDTGAVSANNEFSYTDYVPVGRGETLHLSLMPSAQIYAWVKIACYNGAKTFTQRVNTRYDGSAGSVITSSVSFNWTNSSSSVKYVKITWKSVTCDMSLYVTPQPQMLDVSMIPTPKVIDLPKSVVSMPTVDFSQYVQETTGVSGAKGAIYRNGDYYCITYGENLDGTGTDIPLVSDSGCLAMKYKKFKLTDGSESEVSYGTFAQKGTSYVDYNGDTASFVGGVGLPCGVDDRQYFTSAYTVSDTQGMNYTFAGIANYGMTCCCCDVTVKNDGTVGFGTIKELSLTVDGTRGKFDLHRIDSDYWMTSYMTTTPPYHDIDGWKWLQGVNRGIAYFTSDNGIDWDYQFTIPVGFQPKCEVTGIYKNGFMYFACRTNPSLEKFTDALFVGKINTANAYISVIYQLPFVESRAYMSRVGNEILLFYSPNDKGITECVRICEYGNYELYFWRWFTIYNKCTWYIVPVITNGHLNISDNNIVNGYYFDGSGNPTANAEYCYIDTYYPARSGDVITFKLTSDQTIYYWVKACLYNSSKTCIGRKDFTFSPSSGTSTVGSLTINDANCRYVRITYKNMSNDASYNAKFWAELTPSNADIISEINAVGGIGAVGSTAGMQFVKMSFDTSKPYIPSDIPAIVI